MEDKILIIKYTDFRDGLAYTSDDPDFQYVFEGWTKAKDYDDMIKQIRRYANSNIEISMEKLDKELYEPNVTNSPSEQCGEYRDNSYTIIDFGGACPTQGFGSVDGFRAYYKSRGSGWMLEIEYDEDCTWTINKDVYVFPEGGRLHRDETFKNIELGIAKFRKTFKTEVSQ